MRSFRKLVNILLERPDRLDIQIELEDNFPDKWARHLTNHPQFVPINHGRQSPEHCQAGYSSKANWRKMNPGS